MMCSFLRLVRFRNLFSSNGQTSSLVQSIYAETMKISHTCDFHNTVVINTDNTDFLRHNIFNIVKIFRPTDDFTILEFDCP